jgi:hypothetical protein
MRPPVSSVHNLGELLAKPPPYVVKLLVYAALVGKISLTFKNLFFKALVGPYTQFMWRQIHRVILLYKYVERTND